MKSILEYYNKLKLFLKTKRLKNEPDKVSIRFSSTPNWLYKITLSNPEELKTKVNQFIIEIKQASEKLKEVMKNLKEKEITNLTISQYKKDIFNKKKSIYFENLDELVSRTINFDENTIDDKKKELNSLKKLFQEFNIKKKNYEKILMEFFPKEQKIVDKAFKEILSKLSEYQSIFRNESYEKLNLIIDEIHELKDKIEEKKVLMKEKKQINIDIEGVKKNIFKLSSKEEIIQNTRRYKDVLDERDSLRILMKHKKEEITNIKKMFNKIKNSLPKSKNLEEYTEFFESSIENDHSGILLEEIKKNKKPEDEDIVKWFEENFEKIRKNILQIEADIKNNWKNLRKYVVINELEDIEERKNYFKKKLKEKRNKLNEINTKIGELLIESLKKKIYKDILILTGYDVNIIYDE